MKSLRNQIGSRLEQWFKGKGWTGREFAERMGINEGNVRKYFRGELDAQNLTAALFKEGCDVRWLITGKITNDELRITNEENASTEKLKGLKVKSRVKRKEITVEQFKMLQLLERSGIEDAESLVEALNTQEKVEGFLRALGIKGEEESSEEAVSNKPLAKREKMKKTKKVAEVKAKK